MSEFIRICSVDEIPPGEPLTVEIDGKPVAIGRVGDKYYAIEDICPHQGASFEGGEIEDDILTCPLHGWRTNLVTGQSLEAPSIKVQTYEVKVEDGTIFVKTDPPPE